MKDASMSLGIYFEIKDAELYGGEGTTGQRWPLAENTSGCRIRNITNDTTAGRMRTTNTRESEA